MKTFTITIKKTITAKDRNEAINDFWEFVDEAENWDLSIVKESEGK